jgi:hypothetical protein
MLNDGAIIAIDLNLHHSAVIFENFKFINLVGGKRFFVNFHHFTRLFCQCDGLRLFESHRLGCERHNRQQKNGRKYQFEKLHNYFSLLNAYEILVQKD